ncbi:hypothetical protein BT96DRAFT_961739 [Gymnopus androsaceus JB14]|uniref:DNA replication complex GINS protein PSF3 n=1 Tax=Gymnopus androsaceus JB14 TaxID=1447944 RepID=A0A6A4IID4_9AGAR|nr:hypothetical protein BT96DRAFT_961739 [Gymnopus androsaceus JB14]
MDNDYFSIDAILAENQKVQCKFKHRIPEMGHLGGGSERDITAQSKRQIPLWLAYIIVYSYWADFEIPQPFSKQKPRSVRLSNLVGAGTGWYVFGKKIMDMIGDDQGLEMSEMLVSTFKGRLVDVIDQAQHFAALGPVGGGSGGVDSGPQMFREGLDTTERELFVLAQESARRMKKWYEEGKL